jgi:tripartite-type tricarboxylate transporter receptor subunit TctC
MDRRQFLAASIGLVAGRADRRRARAVRPLTKIIFPFAAGGSGDMLCRQLAHIFPADRPQLHRRRPHRGDGLIGIRAVKGSAPDSTTVLVTTGPTMYLLPMVENQPSFDSAKDFVPVSQLARFEFVVAVSPSIGVTDFKQLVAWIKANPAKASYGVPKQRHHSAFHRMAARTGARPFHDARIVPRLGADHHRSARRAPADLHHDAVGHHHAASRRRHPHRCGERACALALPA